MNKKTTGAFAVLMAAVFCAGCASAPKERFYTLAPAPGPTQQAASVTPPRYAVAIGPIKVPDAVDRPQMVVREGPNRVEILEQQRWAGSLRSEIGRALAAGVGAALPDAQVSVNDSLASRTAAYRVAVDIERFDAALNDSVSVQALWTLRQEGGTLVRSGRYNATEATGPGGHEAIAAAYARALAGMSTVIAEALRAAPPVSAALK